MKPTSDRKQVAGVILLIVSALLIIFLTIYAVVHRTQSTDNVHGRDLSGNAGTGENSPAKTGPSVTNFDNFVNVGVTIDQLTNLSTALSNYQPFKNTQTTIRFDDTNYQIHQPDDSDPLYRPSITTTITVNDKNTYQVRFYYWGTNDIQLLLYDTTGKTQLYDSGQLGS